MLHAWLKVNYFWLTDDCSVRRHFIEYQCDDEISGVVAGIYRDLEEELESGHLEKVEGPGRIKIQGARGFAIVDLNLVDSEERVDVDLNVWGGVFDSKEVEAV